MKIQSFEIIIKKFVQKNNEKKLKLNYIKDLLK
jgi:hypothetical protein